MSSKVFCDISISADGYLAGPDQTADRPFGNGPVDRLHAWMFDTPDENQAEIDRVVAAPLTMQGGTTFTFVTDGIGAALDQARTAAGDRDVAIAGGAATVNQYLAAGLVDELRTHIAPVTLGGANASSMGYRRCTWRSWPSGPRRSPPTSATAYSTTPRAELDNSGSDQGPVRARDGGGFGRGHSMSRGGLPSVRGRVGAAGALQ